MPCRLIRVPAEMNAAALLDWLRRRKNPGNDITARVQAILDEVRAKGDTAVRNYTRTSTPRTFRPNFA